MGLNCAVFLCSAIVLCLFDELHAYKWKMIQNLDHSDHGKKHENHHLSEQQHGGFKKGQDHWDQGEFEKQAKEWGTFGKEKHGINEGHGAEHHNKHGLDHHGEKWAKSNGGHKKAHSDEWKSREHHNIDKGSGYIKKWDWHKEKGEKESQGKKHGHDESHFKKAHGDKHDMKKHHEEAGKKHGHKDHHAKKEWKDHGKKHGESGHHKKNYKSWEEKKPEFKMFKNYLKDAVHKGQNQYYHH